MSGTLASRSRSGDAGAAPDVAYLCRLLEADAPLAPASRHVIDGIERVEIGRAASASAQRVGTCLVLGVPDPRVSEQHARLRFVAGRWVVEDVASKNGIRVNGEPAARAVLDEGDWLECGRTFFVLRMGPTDPGASLDLVADAQTPGPSGIATLSPQLACDLAVLTRVAPTATSVVVIGESGTGKELVARAAHALSGRPGPMVAVNCGALPVGLAEGALFGHRKGAFSGAGEDRAGLIRAADRGTLFLDEIADLAPGAQAALLRALQEREVLPVGATSPVPVDFRLVVAAQRPLDQLAATGVLRPDLVARLSGCPIALPPLRDRLEDLGLLCANLVRRLSPRPHDVRFALPAVRAMLGHRWPLNIRELEKCLEGALVHGPRIELSALPALATAGSHPDPAQTSIDGDEHRARRGELIALLREHRGNVSAIARALNKDRVQIRRWLARYALDPVDFRTGGHSG